MERALRRTARQTRIGSGPSTARAAHRHRSAFIQSLYAVLGHAMRQRLRIFLKGAHASVFHGRGDVGGRLAILPETHADGVASLRDHSANAGGRDRATRDRLPAVDRGCRRGQPKPSRQVCQAARKRSAPRSYRDRCRSRMAGCLDQRRAAIWKKTRTRAVAAAHLGRIGGSGASPADQPIAVALRPRPWIARFSSRMPLQLDQKQVISARLV